nr:nuclease domain-containing protein [uncultured Paenibacillus sp.]
MAPGYREVYGIYLLLMKGLSIQGDLFRLSMKDLAQLYEYWCFLKIHDLMRRKYELVSQDLIKVNRTGLFVTLDRGRKAKMVFRNPRNGEVFTLYYNSLPQGDGHSTLAQRPDNVLTLKKNDAAIEYKYIFDAKYRLNPAYEGTPYWKKYKQPGPEEDDINTMHQTAHTPQTYSAHTHRSVDPGTQLHPGIGTSRLHLEGKGSTPASTRANTCLIGLVKLPS